MVNSFGCCSKPNEQRRGLRHEAWGSPTGYPKPLTCRPIPAGTGFAGRAALAAVCVGESYWARRGCLMGGARPLTGCWGRAKRRFPKTTRRNRRIFVSRRSHLDVGRYAAGLIWRFSLIERDLWSDKAREAPGHGDPTTGRARRTVPTLNIRSSDPGQPSPIVFKTRFSKRKAEPPKPLSVEKWPGPRAWSPRTIQRPSDV